MYGQQLSAGYGGTCMAFAVGDDVQLRISCFSERTFCKGEITMRDKLALFYTTASDLAGKTEKAEHEMKVLACHSFQLAGCRGEENSN